MKAAVRQKNSVTTKSTPNASMATRMSGRTQDRIRRRSSGNDLCFVVGDVNVAAWHLAKRRPLENCSRDGWRPLAGRACPIDRTGGGHKGSCAPIETLGAPRGGLGGRRVLPAVIGARSARGLHDLGCWHQGPALWRLSPPFGTISLGSLWLLRNTRRRFDPSSSPSASSPKALYSLGELAGN
jgi:hypothetical protein